MSCGEMVRIGCDQISGLSWTEIGKIAVTGVVFAIAIYFVVSTFVKKQVVRVKRN